MAVQSSVVNFGKGEQSMADKRLVMTFLNQEGSRTSITLPAIKDRLTEA